MNRYNLNKDIIYNLYHKQNMTLEEVSNYFGCSGALIRLFMEKYDIPRRFPKPRNPNLSKETKLKISKLHHRPVGSIRYNHGYVEVKISLKYSRPLQKKNWKKRSRIVMEQYLGRTLSPKEVVHHINGNKQDDRIENLSLFPKKHHDFVSSLNRIRDKLGRFT